MKRGDFVWVHDIKSAEPRNFPGMIVKADRESSMYQVLCRGSVTPYDAKYVWKFNNDETG